MRYMHRDVPDRRGQLAGGPERQQYSVHSFGAEETLIDPNTGRYVNADLAGYHVIVERGRGNDRRALCRREQSVVICSNRSLRVTVTNRSNTATISHIL